MEQNNIPSKQSLVAQKKAKRPNQRPEYPSESTLLKIRLQELDREFARQTKQLTALTKRLGRKIAGMKQPKSTDSNG